jgi:hypothetical protein
VYVGDHWLDALEQSGFGRSQVTAIDNHLETDRDHSAAGFREIDDLVGDLVPASMLVDAVEQAGRVFEQLCSEICAEASAAAKRRRDL